MQKFTKKPVTIEAVQYDGSPQNEKLLLEWIESDSQLVATGGGYLSIMTLEGVTTVQLGDWIIKGIQGEFYPCKPDIFEKTYTPVNQGTQK